MDGVAFLEALRKIQPDAMSLLLSGQVDRDALAGAIRRTRVFRFIGKPWIEVELAGAVSQALACREALLENRRLAQVYRERFGSSSEAGRAQRGCEVMVVDDEPNVLNAIWRELSHPSRLQGLYSALSRDSQSPGAGESREFCLHVETFTRAADALAKAAEVPYDLVIADYRMPELDGIEFLERFRALRPDAARILLSGEADLEALGAAINRAGVFAFIGKPWNEVELRAAVAQALAWHELLLENRRMAQVIRVHLPGA
jgi:response regulator RpfG family c-di-GMP phosphodiesterase